MVNRFLFAITLSLCSGVVSLSTIAQATTLSSATVQSLRNKVQVQLGGRPFRAAKVKDAMVPQDALKTDRQSMAELRFNDRSLARIGEMTIFEFTPGSRDVGLKQGTTLFLIRPGQGRTTVRTPNATAGIRGSALFVRYIPDNPQTDAKDDVTMVGALTNSDIEISNTDGSQKRVLKAGEMGVMVNNNLVRVYEFDLRQFSQTSPLAEGIDLTGNQLDSDPAIAAVQAETQSAIQAQTPLKGQNVTGLEPWMANRVTQPPNPSHSSQTSTGPNVMSSTPPTQVVSGWRETAINIMSVSGASGINSVASGVNPEPPTTAANPGSPPIPGVLQLLPGSANPATRPPVTPQPPIVPSPPPASAVDRPAIPNNVPVTAPVVAGQQPTPPVTVSNPAPVVAPTPEAPAVTPPTSTSVTGATPAPTTAPVTNPQPATAPVVAPVPSATPAGRPAPTTSYVPSSVAPTVISTPPLTAAAPPITPPVTAAAPLAAAAPATVGVPTNATVPSTLGTTTTLNPPAAAPTITVPTPAAAAAAVAIPTSTVAPTTAVTVAPPTVAAPVTPPTVTMIAPTTTIVPAATAPVTTSTVTTPTVTPTVSPAVEVPAVQPAAPAAAAATTVTTTPAATAAPAASGVLATPVAN